MALILTSIPHVYSRGVSRFASGTSDWMIAVALEKDLAEAIRSHRPDGMIIHANSDKLCTDMRAHGIPLVSTSAAVAEPGCPRVAGDSVWAGRMAARALLHRGHRSIAFVGEARRFYSEERRRGAMAEIAKAKASGCAFAVDPTAPVEGTGCSNWYDSLPPRTALLAASDRIAAWCLAVLRHRHIEAPAIVGIDDDGTICDRTRPTLTSVAWAEAEVGFRAAQRLQLLLDGTGGEPTDDWVPPLGIRHRQSTADWATERPDLLALLAWIDEHCAEAIGVDDLAAVVAMQRRRFEQYCRRHLGLPPRSFIENARMRRAEAALEHGDESVGTIAKSCGFKSTWWFCKRFAEHSGWTPLRWRELIRSG